MNNKKIIILLVLIINMSMALTAQTNSQQKVSLHSFEMVQMNNLWLKTSNPAALCYLQDLLPGIINASYLYEDGEFKRVQQGDKLNEFNFNTYSYGKTKKFNVFGGFNYMKGKEKGLDFSDVNDPFRPSPYHLIDTIGNDNYDREFFSVVGGFSVPLNKKLKFGMSMDFNVGLAVQDLDPRPQNKVFDMDLSPGVIYTMEKFKLGFNLLYKYYNEEIEVKIIQDNADAAFFSTHGLGLAISHESETFNRLQKRNTGGFGVQLEYAKGNLKTLFAGEFLYYEEKNIDARKASGGLWTVEKEDSELKGIQLEISNYTSISKANQMHLFGFELNLNSMIGSEIIQRLEIAEGEDLDHWEYYGSEEKYDALDIKLNVFYEYLQLRKKDNQRDISFKFFALYHDFSEEYYIPMQKQNFKNLKLGVNLYKSFYATKANFTFGAGASYKQNLDAELSLTDYTFIAEKLLAPDYEYITDAYIAPKVDVAVEFPMKKIFDQYFVKAAIESYIAGKDSSRTIFSISTGVTF